MICFLLEKKKIPIELIYYIKDFVYLEETWLWSSTNKFFRDILINKYENSPISQQLLLTMWVSYVMYNENANSKIIEYTIFIKKCTTNIFLYCQEHNISNNKLNTNKFIIGNTASKEYNDIIVENDIIFYNHLKLCDGNIHPVNNVNYKRIITVKFSYMEYDTIQYDHKNKNMLIKFNKYNDNYILFFTKFMENVINNSDSLITLDEIYIDCSNNPIAIIECDYGSMTLSDLESVIGHIDASTILSYQMIINIEYKEYKNNHICFRCNTITYKIKD